MKDGVAFLTQGAEREWDRTIAQFDVARLAHDVVGIGDDEVGESAVVFFESFGALGIRLAGHFCAEVGELLAKLLDLGLGLEVLEGTANSRIGKTDCNGAKGGGVKFWVSLHNIEGALRREGVVVLSDAVNDLALFSLGVWGDGEAWALGSVSDFGGWRAGRSDIGRIDGGKGRVHEHDGRGAEFCLGRNDFDGAAEDVDGGRHVVVGK